MILRRGFAASCDAGLGPAGRALPLKFQAKGRTGGTAPKIFLKPAGKAEPCLTSGGEAGASKDK